METKIRYYRELNNMTQEELSQKSGVSRTIISGLENGILDTTTNTTMKKISDALGVGIMELFYSKNVQ